MLVREQALHAQLDCCPPPRASEKILMESYFAIQAYETTRMTAIPGLSRGRGEDEPSDSERPNKRKGREDDVEETYEEAKVRKERRRKQREAKKARRQREQEQEAREEEEQSPRRAEGSPEVPQYDEAQERAEAAERARQAEEEHRRQEQDQVVPPPGFVLSNISESSDVREYVR